ncbi:MAG: NifB/NifX family molybdenum-iron cluster-binding protein [Pseudomonadales bacterium]|nr:NifB/NifX family molybdenum-iron cluster-binding protein [Pseudomonadales bacterium]
MSTLTRKLDVISDDGEGTFLKVAFATTDRIQVDQHFGSARAFSIYGVNQEKRTLLNVCEFGELVAQDGNEDKVAIKLEILQDCIAVYCRACGASAVKQLLAAGIQPVKVAEGALVDELLDALQYELSEGPSTWLAKAVSRQRVDPSRFDEMEMEGWDE